jgi:uncharacterized protein (DUF4415 family)
MPDRKMTKTERLHYDRFLRNAWELKAETGVYPEMSWEIPEAWNILEKDLDVAEPKDRITLRLDRSVVQFYRAMGRGYQARMNRILATYAQMHILRMLEPDAGLEWRSRYVKALEEAQGKAEREW